MNRTQVGLLIAVLGLATFYLWGKTHKMETEEREYQEKRFFSEKKQEDIGSIRVKSKDPVFEYLLTRRGDRWYLDSHLASQEKSPQLVNSLIELTTEREIHAAPTPGEEKEFGLDDPSYVITLTSNGGDTLGTVLLGDRTPGGNHYYGRLESGGAISTVPAYTLSPLEEEPKDLREDSPFPAEVAAVDRLEFAAEGQTQGTIEREKSEDPEANTKYRIVSPEKKEADETKVSDHLFLLKDMKVARFLGDEERTKLGTPVATYRVHEFDSGFDLVTEFCQPVSINPKLRYGRRFLTKVGSKDIVPGTEERFVIEMLGDSQALHPTLQQFEERRLLRVAVDELNSIQVVRKGSELKAERSSQGAWEITSSSPKLDQASGYSQKLDAVLWALRDLRFVKEADQESGPKESDWSIILETAEGKSLEYRFGQDKTGNPFVGHQAKTYRLQEESLSAINEAAKALWSKAATPTPSPTPDA